MLAASFKHRTVIASCFAHMVLHICDLDLIPPPPGLTSHSRIAASSPQLERLIHFSEAGVAVNHKSRRLRTKALGDEAVLQALPRATIIR